MICNRIVIIKLKFDVAELMFGLADFEYRFQNKEMVSGEPYFYHISPSL